MLEYIKTNNTLLINLTKIVIELYLGIAFLATIQINEYFHKNIVLPKATVTLIYVFIRNG